MSKFDIEYCWSTDIENWVFKLYKNFEEKFPLFILV